MKPSRFDLCLKKKVDLIFALEKKYEQSSRLARNQKLKINNKEIESFCVALVIFWMEGESAA